MPELKLNLLKDSETIWEGEVEGEVKDIKYAAGNNLFWILGNESISTFSPDTKEIEKVSDNSNLTCIEVAGNKIIAGTSDGYFSIDTKSKKSFGINWKSISI